MQEVELLSGMTLNNLMNTLQGEQVLGAKDDIAFHESNVLIGFSNQLYLLDLDLQFTKVSADYMAIGAGQQIALGSLYSLQGQDPETRIKLALSAACEHNPYVCKPFIIECLEPKKKK